MSEQGAYVNIKVKRGCRDRLKLLGRKGETYSDVVEYLLDHKPKRRPKA